MFDRCSSSQLPPDAGRFPSESHFSDPRTSNQEGFYPEHQHFHQNYPHNFPQAQSQQQGAPYPQSRPEHSHFHQFPHPQTGFRPGLNLNTDFNQTRQKGGPCSSDQYTPQMQSFEQNQQIIHQMQHWAAALDEGQQQDAAQVSPAKKKRGRPSKKQPDDESEECEEREAQKKKRLLNRFDGLSVEEVMSRTLPDVIEHNLDILIIGINPGLMSAFKGHHYPNPGNHFWKCLFLSGLTEQQLNYLHDQSLPQKYSIGFTNMVERTTPGSKDLSSKEIREGGRQLLDKLQTYRPLIAAFNGKGIYEIFCKETFGVKAKNLEFGLQPYKIPQTETVCFLMPSSSPRCAQFPRAQDKVHFYIKLKELRDQLKGTERPRDVEETKYSFDLDLAKEDAKRLAIKEEQHDPEYESWAGGSAEPTADV